MDKVSHRMGDAIGHSGLLATLDTELAIKSAGPLALLVAPNQEIGGKSC